MFVTLFYGILHTGTGVLEYCNAGHNVPYVFSPDGELVALKESGGPMMGLFTGIQYTSRNAEVRAGEGVLAYTDGVIEARNKQGDFFEDSRLQKYLASTGSRTAEQLVRDLHSEVARFEAGAPRADDVTVLAIRRRG